MSANRRFSDAIKTLDLRKDDKPLYFSGMLGTIINGVSVIHIPSRPGFVWVRLRSVSNELIQAYNSLVSPIYDLPVIVERDPLDPTRYSIIGRDVGRYDSWGVANSPAYTNPVYQTTYYPDFYNNGAFVASSGTVIDFGANLNVVVSGSSVFVSAVDTNRILIYEDSTYKATGTAINFGANLNVAVTGSTVFVSAVDTVGGGGGGDLLIYDDAAFKVTGTSINFGSNLEVTVTGSTAYVQAVGGGFSGELPIYDGATFKVTGTAINFGDNLSVAVTGTTAFVNAAAGGGGGGGGGDGHITIIPFSYNSVGQGTWRVVNSASSMFQSYLNNFTEADQDNVTYKVYLQSGTYTFLVYYHVHNFYGIMDINLDGTEIFSKDCYSPSGAFMNQRGIASDIGIASSGIKDLVLKADGKNTGSAYYDVSVAYMALWRTA